jgi:hypothetical protein
MILPALKALAKPTDYIFAEYPSQWARLRGGAGRLTFYMGFLAFNG